MTPERIRVLAGILAASERAGGTRAESLTGTEEGLPARPDDILDRIATNFAVPSAEAAQFGIDSGKSTRVKARASRHARHCSPTANARSLRCKKGTLP